MLTPFVMILSGMALAHPGDHGPPTPVVPKASTPSPIDGFDREQVCKDNALLLIKYPINELENAGWRQFCCYRNPVFDDGRCELDWLIDVPKCEVWDTLRNEIYARYGYPFKQKKWKKWAAKYSWYSPREDFEDSWLGSVARENVEKLKEYSATKHHCQP